MDYNTLIQSIGENWAAIMSTVVLTGGSFWALFGKITNNKFSGKLSGMETNFSKKIDAVGQITFENLKKVDAVVSKLQANMTKLESLNKTVTDENLVLSNLVVELVALAPIPLSAKSKFYDSLHDMAIINDKVKETVNALIQSQEETKKVETQKEQEIYTKLDEV